MPHENADDRAPDVFLKYGMMLGKKSLAMVRHMGHGVFGIDVITKIDQLGFF